MEEPGIESFKSRLRRFLHNSPKEFILTITNSVANFLAAEIQKARECGLYKMIFLGAHAVMQIIGERVYGRSGHSATEFFLEEFVDVGENNHNFSKIASELHQLRNGIAHQWFTKQGHSLHLDGNMKEGWKKSEGVLYINPNIYADQILSAFDKGSPFYDKWRHMTPKVLRMRKYYFLKEWLNLSGELSKKIKKIDPNMDDSKFEELEAEIVRDIEKKYGLD